MNEEPPNPLDTIGDDPVEARIVAWVLGEASAFEAAELERLCGENPELESFRRRMLSIHGLLAEAEAPVSDGSWKLPAEKRVALEEILGPQQPAISEVTKEIQIRRSGRRALWAIAACLVVSVVIARFIGPIGPISPIQTAESTISFSPKPTPEAELAALNKAIRDQEDKVEEQRKVLSTIVRTKGVIYKGQDSFYGASGVNEDQGASSALQAYNQLEQEKMQLESQITSLLKYDSDQLIVYAAGLDLPDNIIKNVYPQYLERKMQLDSLKVSGLGDNHATVRAAKENIEGMKRQLDEGVVNLRATLEAQLQLADERLKRVEVAKDDTRENAIKRGLDAQDYVDVKRQFESEQQLLQAMKLKQVELSVRQSALSADIAKADSAPDELALAESRASLRFQTPQAPASPMDGPARARARVVPPSATPAQAVAEPESLASMDSAPAEPRAEFAGAIGNLSSVTDGLRSGDQAVNRNNIDAILNNPNRAAGADLDAIAMNKPETAAPLRSNPAVTHEATEAVDQVRRDLYLAEGKLNLGKYEDAKKLYDDVLQKDPSNAAARSGLDKTKSATTDYYRAAYADILPQIDQEGELSLPADSAPSAGVVLGREMSTFGNQDSGLSSLDEYSDHFAGTKDRATWASTSDSKLELEKMEAGGPNPLKEVLEGKADFRLYAGYRQSLSPDTGELEEQAESLRRQLEEPSLADSNKQVLFRDWQETQKKLAEREKAKVTPLESIEETTAATEPYSTFSLNINDASFQIAKTALEKGERPDPASIKTEQFYNAVDYGDPSPASNEPVTAFIEQSAHPVIPGRNLVRVSLKTAAAGRGASQPLRLTLLVDQSGSMVREDRRAAMATALRQLAPLLTAEDRINVVGFSRAPRLLAEGLTGEQAARLPDLINSTASEGGTNLEEALKLGELMAARNPTPGAQNRIVLFTDGAANLGNADPERLATRIKALRQQGIAFDIAGVGADGLNDRLLGELARHGNGRYHVVDATSDSFARQLAGAFRPAAENVKVQVHFNPERVGSYKLIGFEKDRLKTEDFRNDSVDAAELAAEEAGVAIYQVETLPEGSGEIGEVSVRFRDTAKGEMVERKWTMPYESATLPFDRATPSMQLAGLSMLAAEKLRGGPLADAIDFKQLAETTATVKQFYGGSPRVASMLQVIEMLK